MHVFFVNSLLDGIVVEVDARTAGGALRVKVVRLCVCCFPNLHLVL